MKSLSLLRIALDLTAGRNLFDAERFRVTRPTRVLYLTEEDPDRMIRDRLELHRRGLDLEGVPEELSLLVRRGISLDNPEHRRGLRKVFEAHQTEVVILEPMRALTSAAEGTAADFKEIADWIRGVQSSTPCKAFILAAHWKKPQQWERRGGGESQLADKVAGGALFSFSDCLVGCEKLEWNSTALIPSHYKLGADPPPFVVTWATPERSGSAGEPLFGDWIRPEIDEAESVEEVRSRQHQLAILEYITEHPWLNNHRIAEGMNKSPNTVLVTLRQLVAKEMAVCVKHKNSKRYAKVGAEWDEGKIP